MRNSSTITSSFATKHEEQEAISIPSKFTKRSNWVQCILEGLPDFLHVLSTDGRIIYVSQSCKSVTGYEPNQLLGRFIGELIHPDDNVEFAKEFEDAILYANRFRIIYRFLKFDNTWVILESQCRPYFRDEVHRKNRCLEVSVMARPYLTQNGILFDSILHHHFERERLTRQIAELRRENAEFDVVLDRQIEMMVAPAGLDRPIDEVMSQEGHMATQPAPTSQSLSKHPGVSARDSVTSATIEIPTDMPLQPVGKYDSAGTECAGSISVGDLGIPVPKGGTFKRASNRRARKRDKVTEPHVCMFCGTFKSPEWRRGPNGPKTLCNACGLRWSKRLNTSKRTTTNNEGRP